MIYNLIHDFESMNTTDLEFNLKLQQEKYSRIVSGGF